jgi:hypothetical protein
MKKNLMIGVLLTIFTIPSCNKFDEIPDTARTSSLTIERHSGITFTNKELTIWRERAINGPYKTKGDRFTESPGSWDAVIVRAEKFMKMKLTNTGMVYWFLQIRLGPLILTTEDTIFLQQHFMD